MRTEDAIKHFGSPKLLAKALKLTVQRIYQFGEDVPELLAYKLQVLTAGTLQAGQPEKDRRSKPGAGRSLTGAKSRAGGRKMAGSRSVAK